MDIASHEEPSDQEVEQAAEFLKAYIASNQKTSPPSSIAPNRWTPDAKKKTTAPSGRATSQDDTRIASLLLLGCVVFFCCMIAIESGTGMPIGIAFLLVPLSFLVGSFAQSRGYDHAVGTLCSLLLSPLIGFLIFAVIQPNREVLEARALRSGAMKKCHACAELIRREATKCRYCGEPLDPLKENARDTP